MMHPPRRLPFLILLTALAATARGQAPPSVSADPELHPPFAKPGTPRHSERIRSFDVKHIRADLKLDLEAGTLSGTVAHTLAPLHASLSRLELDCGAKLKVERVTIGSSDVEAAFEQKGDVLAINLDPARPPGENFGVTIAYSGKPVQGMHFVPPDAAHPDRPRAVWTQGQAEENHFWLPCYDAPNDPATTEMVVTVAKPYSVVSNGSLVETKENPDGTRTFHWKMEQPHSSYLITIAASDFNAFHDAVGSLPVDYYVLKNVDEETARRFMGKTPRMIEFFNKVTGQGYPYPKYAQVCLPEFYGGMENTSATSMPDLSLLDRLEAQENSQEYLVAHELSHQWFGDLLTCKDWSHLWLNEGFASYFAPLFTEHDQGEDEFRLQMLGELESYLAADLVYRRPIVEYRYENATQLFDGMAYSKGAWVLHALRGVVGEEAFWKGVKRYVAVNKFRNVETDDLQKAFETVTGKQLGWFFDQWLYKAGHPELKASWRYEPDDSTVRLKVEQTQKIDDETPMFRLPTTVEIIEAPGQSRSIPVVIDGPIHEFVLPAPVEPRAVLLDPRVWIPRTMDFQRPLAERLFLLKYGSSAIVRLEAAESLGDGSIDSPEVREARASAWKHEKSPSAAAKMLATIARGEEVFRPALIEAAAATEPRVRVEAVMGLSRLSRDDASEDLLRKVWADPDAPYGARKAALRGLTIWKVADAEKILNSALELTVGRHTLASTALVLLMDRPGSRSREMAAAYLAPGRPPRLRYAALQALEKLAEDDAALQDLIVPLAEDPDRHVRTRAWELIGSHRIKKALPLLEKRLQTEDFGFNADARGTLEGALKALKEPEPSPAIETPRDGALPPDQAAEIRRQLDVMERQIRAIRERLDASRPE